MSVWATVWIVIIGVALFFAMPRIGTGYFSRAATQALLLSGFTDTVELGTIGEVKLSSALVMRTRAIDGSPSAAFLNGAGSHWTRLMAGHGRNPDGGVKWCGDRGTISI